MLSLLLLSAVAVTAAVPPPPLCGLAPGPLNTSTPNVLVVGDAVSAAGSGYLHHLQRLLSPGLATVQHASTGGLMTSAAAAQCLGGWLGGKEWDVVVVSLGLGDCGNGGGGSSFVPNLRKLVSQAGRGGSTPVIYVTATPSPSSLPGINRSCVAANNRAATLAMPTGAGARRCPYRRVVKLGALVEDYCGGASYQACRIQNAGSVLFNVSDSEPSGLQVGLFPPVPAASSSPAIATPI
jgi:hypothetical protein